MSKQPFSLTGYDPRWRWSLASQPPSGEDDAWVVRYRKFLADPAGSTDEDMRVAHSCFVDQNLQAYLEAMLTAQATAEFCAEYYCMEEKAVEAYSMVFFDLAPVRGAGAKSAIVLRSSPPGCDAHKLKRIALRYGLNVLRWQMGEPVELTEEELDSLYRKVQQGLAMRLQELETTRPTEHGYPNLLKTVDTATKFREALRNNDSNKDEERLVDLLKKNLSSEKEACFDREQVLASRAVQVKEEDS